MDHKTKSRVSKHRGLGQGLAVVDLGTGKSLSEALIFAEHGENMLCT